MEPIFKFQDISAHQISNLSHYNRKMYSWEPSMVKVSQDRNISHDILKLGSHEFLT